MKIPNECKYCGIIKPLCDAHIYPRSWYNSEELNKIISRLEGQFPKTVRKGLYDQGITCAECDNEFGADETYCGQILENFTFTTIGKPVIEVHPQLLRIDADGRRMRRAILFLLWKMTKSQFIMFANVYNAPYSERIKHELKNNRGLGFEINIFYYEDFISKGVFFAEPTPRRMLGGVGNTEYRNVIMIPIGRCTIMINVDSRPIIRPYTDYIVNNTQIYLIPMEFKNNGICKSSLDIIDSNPNAFTRHRKQK